MECITSKNICLLIKDILELEDKRVMEHGAGVGYLVYRMLEETGRFEMFELAELSFIVSLHNIGAYRTDDIGEMLQYGYKKYMLHSMYGYLFMKNILPNPEYGKILLYHHMDFDQMSAVTYEFKYVSEYIRIADDAYTFYEEAAGHFDYKSLKAEVGRKYSGEAYELFEKVQQKHDALKEVYEGSYKAALNQLMDFVLFSDEEKQKYLEMLMYCGGLRSMQGMENVVRCVCICDELAQRLGLKREDRQRLYLATLLHDSGMLLVPKEILEKPNKLSESEMEVVHFHVKKTDEVLRERLKDKRVAEIAMRHHERLDGSGYPIGLKAALLQKPERILQVADTVCGISGKRTYHEARTREEACRILSEEAERGRLDTGIVSFMIEDYDNIMKHSEIEAEKMLATYRRIEKQYEAAKQRME